MKMLITGAAGFIGSNFCFLQVASHPEDEIVLLDKLTYAGCYKTVAPLVNKGVRFVRADICDERAMAKLFSDCHFDVVVNFAAESHVDRSIEDPGKFLRTNVEGTRVLLDMCLRYDVARFHQVSTDEVYGDLPFDRPDLLFTEETPLSPSSPYSASKASADLFVSAYARTFGLPTSISRCSNNYGPYQFPEKLIPLMTSRALVDEPLPVYGEGLNIRDWLYVEDHCRAIDLIVREGKPNLLYNVGGNNEMRNIDIVMMILNRLDKPDSLISYVEDRKGHDRRYGINPSKIKFELGWEPATRFSDGISRTIDWYLEHQDWWRNILDGSYLKINEEITIYV